MLFRLLADLTVLLHLLFVVFVVLGGMLALTWRRAVWIHPPAAVWGVVVEWRGLVCPLTPLENWLRQRGGEAGYAGGFVEHYLLPVLYPSGLTRELQLALGIGVVLVNAVVYTAVACRWRRSRKSSATTGGSG